MRIEWKGSTLQVKAEGLENILLDWHLLQEHKAAIKKL
jgi:hypothetical protein